MTTVTSWARIHWAGLSQLGWASKTKLKQGQRNVLSVKIAEDFEDLQPTLPTQGWGWESASAAPDPLAKGILKSWDEIHFGGWGRVFVIKRGRRVAT